MHCPFCGNEDTQVKDSRITDDGSSVRRRRECGNCGGRFTTFERVQVREIFVKKSSGASRLFDRDKLLRSLNIAARKRPITEDQIEQLVNKIIREIASLGENEVPTSVIGTKVMAALRELDDVAYIRYTSVYSNFKDAKAFERFIKKHQDKKKAKPAASKKPKKA
ncbi:MAG: transcriptional regulator NrdR [Alphaproteobacteria bacterium CG11_big_fil_rev_8_21_14_0_20_44_7]|nr:MAG: transcriptional regulator NrdR [Alphaproteobacteria bacterium CG11_big_fil_rev_8_21_14_0_20_44_7]